MSSPLTHESPFGARLLAWAAERFPAPNGVFCLVLYGAALICGRTSSAQGPIAITAADGAGFLAAYAFLLMLRVFDEHKDYESDVRNFPQRVLQRGLITLGHLKVLGALAIALQLGVSLWLDCGGGCLGAVTRAWLLVFGWSCLMAKEFFIGEWLGRRLVLYALSHMVVLPMALLWMAQMGAGQRPLGAGVWLLAALSFLSGSSLEIGRKTRAPEQERAEVDSYSKALGLRGAVGALVTISLLTSGLLVLALSAGAGGEAGPAPSALSPLTGALAVGAALLPTAVLLRFLRAPSPKGAKMNEAALGLQAILSYLTLSGAWLAQRGLS